MYDSSSSILLPALALMCDWICGDPQGWSWHPARIVGRLCNHFEPFFRTLMPSSPRAAGVACGGLIICTCVGTTLCLTLLAQHLTPILGGLLSLCFVYSAIAMRDLYRHSEQVLNALESEDLVLARVKLSMIVGRDTDNLSEPEIVRATIETVAENTVDGVTSPLFYAFIGLLIGGLAGAATGAILYRTANTLDSMFGHMNERYHEFGWFSARFDDLLNYLPARLSVIAIYLACFICGYNYRSAWQIAKRDGRRHRSPNSGLSEAAFSGALGIRLGGLNFYAEEPYPTPEIGEALYPLQRQHIKAANKLLIASSIVFCLICYLIMIII